MNPALIYCDVRAIWQTRPIIHNLTNLVVMQQTANALLAIGASPIMAHAEQELQQLAALAQAIVLNMGTPDEVWLRRAMQLCEYAKQLQKPLVFDPVGVMASDFRLEVADTILQTGAVSVLRANASEVLALSGINTSGGVDSHTKPQYALQAAQQVATQYTCVVVMSGKEDHIVSPNTLALRGAQQRGNPGCDAESQVEDLDCHVAALLAMTGEGVDDVANVAMTGGGVDDAANTVIMGDCGDDVGIKVLRGGSEMQRYVTGMGCTASALLAAFLAVNDHHFIASCHAMVWVARAAEVAMQRASGPGSFAMQFFDALYNNRVVAHAA